MAQTHQLVDASSGDVIIAKLQLAETFWQRFRGLQLRRTLASDEALLLRPCRSIHTHWMRFSIDVAMLDEMGVVLSVIHGQRPWRFVPRTEGTHSIVEAAAGSLATRLDVGTRVQVASSGSDTSGC